MRTLLLCLGVIFLWTNLPAQEICDNSIDDDGDALIDLNDQSDCSCALSSSTSNLLPNPSFELYGFEGIVDGSVVFESGPPPNGPSQTNSLLHWQQPSEGTGDAWNLISYESNPPKWPAAIPQPSVGGLGMAGFYADAAGLGPGYREFIATCLPDGPLLQNTLYRFGGYFGFAAGGPDNSLAFNVYSPSPVKVALFGITECHQIQFEGNGCPYIQLNDTVWQVLDTFLVSGPPNSWQYVTTEFQTDTFDFKGFAIGASCDEINLPASNNWRFYYFIDELQLEVVESFTRPEIGPIRVSSPNPCADSVIFYAPTIPGASYQWYKDGIAILEATDSV
ncbi:MAG: hypothetical protein AAFQ37_10210, partial [Bacteroidota bacterium]